MRNHAILMGVAGSVLLALANFGCASGEANFNPNGAVFYADGAGGGGITNWGAGVQEGLKRAGYTGTFDEYSWETGLGVIADQEESVSAKRAQGQKMAKLIMDYKAKYPDSPVDLIGLSAGTLIVVYALEAMPESAKVDEVVLLSSSISGDYDLTKALMRVSGDMYVTTSPNDSVLSTLAPAFGTADRKYTGQNIAGLHGFQMPMNAGPQTRRLYSKVMLMAWDPSWESYGDAGGHTDTAKPSFVQHVIAPLIMDNGPRYTRAHPQGVAGKRESPASGN